MMDHPGQALVRPSWPWPSHVQAAAAAENVPAETGTDTAVMSLCRMASSAGLDPSMILKGARVMQLKWPQHAAWPIALQASPALEQLDACT